MRGVFVDVYKNVECFVSIYNVFGEAEAVAVPAGALEEEEEVLEDDGAVDGLVEVDVPHVPGAELVDEAAGDALRSLVDGTHGRVVDTPVDGQTHLVEGGGLCDALDAVGSGVLLCEEAERRAGDLVPNWWTNRHCL